MQDRISEIVLIEDDSDDAEMTMYTLRKNNFANNIIHLEDGVRALEYLFSEGNSLPALILLDLKMPKVDGIEVLRALKNDPVRQKIPVIVFISSREGKKYVENAQIKPDAYLIKPLDSKNFLDAIMEIGLSNILFASKKNTE